MKSGWWSHGPLMTQKCVLWIIEQDTCLHYDIYFTLLWTFKLDWRKVQKSSARAGIPSKGKTIRHENQCPIHSTTLAFSAGNEFFRPSCMIWVDSVPQWCTSLIIKDCDNIELVSSIAILLLDPPACATFCTWLSSPDPIFFFSTSFNSHGGRQRRMRVQLVCTGLTNPALPMARWTSTVILPLFKPSNKWEQDT